MTDDLRIQLTSDSKRRLDRFLAKTDPEVVRRELLGLFTKEGRLTARNVSRKFLSGQRLAIRAGSLARSVEGRGVLHEGLPAIRVGVFRGPALQYARVHELGTKGKGGTLPTIMPRRAKALAVPNRDNKRVMFPSGAPRYPSPRQFPGELSFIPFRRGTKAIGALYEKDELDELREKAKAARGDTTKRPKGAEAANEGFTLRDATAAYFLLSSADIEPKHYLRDGMLQALPRIALELSEFLADRVTDDRGGTS